MHYVYYLYYRGIIVYVGETDDYERRLLTHVRDCEKDFTFARVECYDDKFLAKRVEQDSIAIWQPEYNKEIYNTKYIDAIEESRAILVDLAKEIHEFSVTRHFQLRQIY